MTRERERENDNVGLTIQYTHMGLRSGPNSKSQTVCSFVLTRTVRIPFDLPLFHLIKLVFSFNDLNWWNLNQSEWTTKISNKNKRKFIRVFFLLICVLCHGAIFLFDVPLLSDLARKIYRDKEKKVRRNSDNNHNFILLFLFY